MRAETRHQMKEDRFSQVTLESWAKTQDWAASHVPAVIAGVVVLLIIAGGVFGGWYYLDQQDKAASTMLNQVVRTMNTGIRPAGTPPSPEFPSFGSANERATAAQKQLQAIIAQYPHTHSADFAHYLLGVTSEDLGNTSQAESDFQAVASSSNDDLASLAKLALASVYRSNNRPKDAIVLYQQLIAKPTSSVGKATAQLELAAAYQENNQPSEAKKTYEEVQKDNPTSPVARLATSKLQDLK